MVERVRSIPADHLLITGDLTTTALPAEFQDARDALGPTCSIDPSRVSVIPGNHDRYTDGSVRHRQFEKYRSAMFAPSETLPLAPPSLDPDTAILGLDATRAHISAKGLLAEPASSTGPATCSPPRVEPSSPPHRRQPLPGLRPPASRRRAEAQADEERPRGRRLARHARAPSLLLRPRPRRLGVRPSSKLPNQLCLNSGAPLLRDPTGLRPPGFLEIETPRSRRLRAPSRLGRKRLGKSAHSTRIPAFFPAAETTPSVA